MGAPAEAAEAADGGSARLGSCAPKPTGPLAPLKPSLPRISSCSSPSTRPSFRQKRASRPHSSWHTPDTSAASTVAVIACRAASTSPSMVEEVGREKGRGVDLSSKSSLLPIVRPEFGSGGEGKVVKPRQQVPQQRAHDSRSQQRRPTSVAQVSSDRRRSTVPAGSETVILVLAVEKYAGGLSGPSRRSSHACSSDRKASQAGVGAATCPRQQGSAPPAPSTATS